ncbi:MAG: hypothetical protein BJ554DRAFT_4740, partial [Olpidium bornovanus]
METNRFFKIRLSPREEPTTPVGSPPATGASYPVHVSTASHQSNLDDDWLQEGRGGPASSTGQTPSRSRCSRYIPEQTSSRRRQAELDEKDTLALATQHLDGQAYLVWQSHTREFPRGQSKRWTTWAELRAALTLHFYPRTNLQRTMDELLNLSQRKCRNNFLEKYIEKFNTLLIELPFPRDMALWTMRFHSGLQTESKLRIMTMVPKLHDFNEVQEAARRASRISGTYAKNKPVHRAGATRPSANETKRKKASQHAKEDLQVLQLRKGRAYGPRLLIAEEARKAGEERKAGEARQTRRPKELGIDQRTIDANCLCRGGDNNGAAQATYGRYRTSSINLDS